MTYQENKNERVSLTATRRALGKTRESSIREDLERLVAGAELCLQHREIYLAFDAIRTLVTTVVALNRTISPDATVAILDGLREDSETSAMALQRGLGFTKNENSKCNILPGTGPGTSSCVQQQDATCYTLDSGSGCGGTSGFHFVWELATAIA